MGEVKLSPCLIKHRAMKLQKEVELWDHEILTLLLDGVVWLVSHPRPTYPSEWQLRYSFARRRHLLKVGPVGRTRRKIGTPARNVTSVSRFAQSIQRNKKVVNKRHQFQP
jgi:hypothetical protein